MDKKLGETIKERRKSKGWNLADLAKSSGVSLCHIGRIEDGTRFPSAKVLKKLAGPLGFSEIELFKLAGFLSSDGSEIKMFKMAGYLSKEAQ